MVGCLTEEYIKLDYQLVEGRMHRNPEQKHRVILNRITGWLGQADASEDCLVQSPGQAGPPRTGRSEQYPVHVCVTLRMEVPQPLWATFFHHLTILTVRKFFSYV